MKLIDEPAVETPMPDIQSSQDDRHIAIDKVGVCGLRHPIKVCGGSGAVQATVAQVSMSVDLPHDRKGTHMSRFVDMLNHHEEPFSVADMPSFLSRMRERLDASSAFIELTFPYFIRKNAPVTGQASLLDYEVTLRGEISPEGCQTTMRMVIPVTSLCPCSKEISAYGAHNQRSHVTVDVRFNAAMSFDELVALVEKQASCELFALLKRGDEKYVTERAYDNPKFVEDIVRDVSRALKAEPRIRFYRVEVENFESIHAHSAYAIIEHDKEDA